MTPDDVCVRQPPAAPEYSDAKVLRMWEQAAGELRGYATALARGNAGITAAQLRMACQLGDELFAMKTAGKVKCPECKGHGSINNPAGRGISPPWVDCPNCEGSAWIDGMPARADEGKVI